MRLTRTRSAFAATVVTALALAPTAQADSGTITITSQEPLGSSMELGFKTTVTKDNCSADNCNWYPVIFGVAPGHPCATDTIVALPRSTSIHGTPGTFTDDLGTGVVAKSARLCLYVSTQAAQQYEFVGQRDYQAPSSGPAPGGHLGMARARRAVKPFLRHRFGRRFAQRRGYRQSCRRLSPSAVRCRVRWTHRSTRYSGVLRIRIDPKHPRRLQVKARIRRS